MLDVEERIWREWIKAGSLRYGSFIAGIHYSPGNLVLWARSELNGFSGQDS
jgi:hypothetical protein